MKKLDVMMRGENQNLPITTRYTPEQLKKYEHDLKYVVSKAADGACLPTVSDLRAYFQEEHGVTLAEGTIRRHIKNLQAGQEIWPK